MDIKVGDKHEIDYPFHNKSYGAFQGKEELYSIPGCHRLTDEYENEWGTSTELAEWVANFEGKICYEVLSIAKMPGKYMDRVIVKYHYQLPNGDICVNAKIKTLTTGKLKSQIKLNKVFPCAYEVDGNFAENKTYSDVF